MPLPHIPSGHLLAGCTPHPARGPLFLFRKILNYAKSKKSTHGHTNPKPIRTHFGLLVVGGAPGRGLSNEPPTGAAGALRRAVGPVRAASRVGRRLATLDRPPDRTGGRPPRRPPAKSKWTTLDLRPKSRHLHGWFAARFQVQGRADSATLYTAPVGDYGYDGVLLIGKVMTGCSVWVHPSPGCVSLYTAMKYRSSIFPTTIIRGFN